MPPAPLLGAANIIIDQATLGPGVAGRSRNDGVVAQVVTLKNADNTNALKWQWVLETPRGSNAFLSSPASASCQFTPDRRGTYAVTLFINEGKARTQVMKRLLGVKTAGGLRYPAQSEGAEANWTSIFTGNPNETGWWEDLMLILQSISAGVEASFLTVDPEVGLVLSRQLIAGTGVTFTDLGPGSTLEITSSAGIALCDDVPGEAENLVSTRTVKPAYRSQTDFGQVNLGSESNALDYGTRADYATVSGGWDNVAASNYSVVGGGNRNEAADLYAGVFSGGQNVARGEFSAVLGGTGNEITADKGCIGGGDSNSISETYSFIGGGDTNIINTQHSTIGGGFANVISVGNYSFIGGGSGNSSTKIYSAIAGGFNNVVAGDNCFIGGGTQNQANEADGFIGGGTSNVLDGSLCAIGGGTLNEASSYACTVAGGYNNHASGDYSTIGGGYHNQTTGTYAVVAGGHECHAVDSYCAVIGGTTNVAQGIYALVAGGYFNNTDGESACVIGGSQNLAQAWRAVVIGGTGNYAGGDNAAVVGGGLNQAIGTDAFIAGGSNNMASNFGSVALGSDNSVQGDYSMSIGRSCSNSGNYTIALGRSAQPINEGAHVFKDGAATSVQSTADNQLTLSYAGGIRLLFPTTQRLRKSGYAGSSNYVEEVHGSVSTTNATPATSLVITIPSGQDCHIKGVLKGKQSGTNAARVLFYEASYTNNGGTVALVGAALVNTANSTGVGSTWATAVNINAGTLEIAITGAAATTIRWTWNFECSVGGAT